MATTGNNGTWVPRIVMIDDEISNLQIVKIILSREHFVCQLNLFGSGQEALDYLAVEGADLVLLDLSMPGMDGFEVMKVLKSDPDLQEIPVVFLTALHDTKFILEAFELGATDFIGKPIISPLLIARIRNVLQTRRLQQQLINSNRELVATDQLKDDLLSICSHDLRSPLSSIDLLCQFMVDSLAGRSDTTPGELVSRINSQARMARRLVENLLDMSKIEEGRLVPQHSFFQLNDLMRTASEGEAPFLESKSLSFGLELPEEDWLCYGDREILGQVVHNVLNNAAKNARERVSLKAEVVSFSEASGGRVAITVGDDGAGIPPDRVGDIFEKFSKAESQAGGSGLGLYISRKMVDLLHGHIEVESTSPQGTSMRIEIPNVFRVDQIPDLHALSNRKVLVFSTSKITRELLTGLLTEAGLVDVLPVSSVENLVRERGAVKGDNALPRLVVVDGESRALVSEALAPLGTSHAPEGIGTLAEVGRHQATTSWLVFGGGEDQENAAPGLPPPCQVVGYPLNPLEFLRALESLSQIQRNFQGAGVV